MLTVLPDNAAALVGLFFAFAGIFLGRLTGITYLDGMASLLAREGLDKRAPDDIRRMTEADPAVTGAGNALTMFFGPESILLALDVQFRTGCSAGEIASAVDRLETCVRAEHPISRRFSSKRNCSIG